MDRFLAALDALENRLAWARIQTISTGKASTDTLISLEEAHHRAAIIGAQLLLNDNNS